LAQDGTVPKPSRMKNPSPVILAILAAVLGADNPWAAAAASTNAGFN
jgi:hypothetical protein